MHSHSKIKESFNAETSFLQIINGSRILSFSADKSLSSITYYEQTSRNQSEASFTPVETSEEAESLKDVRTNLFKFEVCAYLCALIFKLASMGMLGHQPAVPSVTNEEAAAQREADEQNQEVQSLMTELCVNDLIDIKTGNISIVLKLGIEIKVQPLFIHWLVPILYARS